MSIVNDVKNELNNYSDSDTIRWLRFAERCISELSIFDINNIATKDVTINKNINTAPIPSDSLRILRIGVRQRNGRIYTLTEDQELGFSEKAISCETVDIKGNDRNGWIYQSTGGVSELGTYRINQKQFRIELFPRSKYSKLTIEYISSGIKQDGITYAPEIARESVIAYILWKNLKGKATVPANHVKEAEMEYYRQKTMLNEAQRVSIDELYDTILAGYSPIIRR